MDLNLYARVLWRFRILVTVGFLLAVGLTFLAVVRVSTATPHFSYRKSEKWQSTAVLFVSPAGYPYRTNSATAIDPATFAQIASNFAMGDQVRTMLRRQGSLDGKIQSVAENDGDGHTLPFVDVTGIASSPRAAISLADRAAEVLQRYVVDQQTAQGVDPSKRIGLQFVSTANKATINTPRGKALPALLFVLIMAVTIGTAFVLENLRPRPRQASASATEPAAAPDVRLSA